MQRHTFRPEEVYRSRKVAFEKGSLLWHWSESDLDFSHWTLPPISHFCISNSGTHRKLRIIDAVREMFVRLVFDYTLKSYCYSFGYVPYVGFAADSARRSTSKFIVEPAICDVSIAKEILSIWYGETKEVECFEEKQFCKTIMLFHFLPWNWFIERTKLSDQN